MRAGWLTPDSLPSSLRYCTISFPDSEEFHSLVRGALFLLSDEANWEEFGSLTVTQTADAFRDMLVRFFGDDCMQDPVGTIMAYVGESAPSGFLLCDGAQYPQADYPDLYAVVGDVWGGADSGFFRVPDLKGRVPVGRDINTGEFQEIGDVGGATTVTLSTSQIPAHTHVQDAHAHSIRYGVTNNNGAKFMIANGGSQDASVAGSMGADDGTATIASKTATNQNTGGGGSHDNLPPYAVINYIIRF